MTQSIWAWVNVILCLVYASYFLRLKKGAEEYNAVLMGMTYLAINTTVLFLK